MLLSKRSLLGIAAVVDIAIHGRSGPVAAKALAKRHNLPPRHLETILQVLVHGTILKGVRGPRGGYELAKERRRISAGDIIRAISASDGAEEGSDSKLIELVIQPKLQSAEDRFLMELDKISIEDLCLDTEANSIFSKDNAQLVDFTI